MRVLAYSMGSLTLKDAEKISRKLVHRLEQLKKEGDPRAPLLASKLNEYLDSIEKGDLRRASLTLEKLARDLKKPEAKSKPKSGLIKRLKKRTKALLRKTEKGLNRLVDAYYYLVRPFALILHSLGSRSDRALRLLEKEAQKLEREAEIPFSRHPCTKKIVQHLSQILAQKAVYYLATYLEYKLMNKRSRKLEEAVQKAWEKLRRMTGSIDHPKLDLLAIPEKCRKRTYLLAAADKLGIEFTADVAQLDDLELIQALDNALDTKAGAEAQRQLTSIAVGD